MTVVDGVPDGYVWKTAGLVGKSADLYFQGDQAVIIDIQCFSLPVTVTVSKVQRVQVQNWWTQFLGATNFCSSISNSFHIFEQHLLAATIIEFRGPAVGVAGDTLGGFQGAMIFQKIRNKLLTFANSISGKNTRTSLGWWKSLS
jgi:hypothetical protein